MFPTTRLATLAVAGLLCACAHSEVTVMFGPRWNGYYTELAGTLEVARKFEGRKLCAYRHESEVRNGYPFNDTPEQTSDAFLCGIRWDGSARR